MHALVRYIMTSVFKNFNHQIFSNQKFITRGVFSPPFPSFPPSPPFRLFPFAPSNPAKRAGAALAAKHFCVYLEPRERVW